MNRTDFGKLIASLRSDLGWTQAKLAEVAEIDIAIISQIERGVKKHFDPEQLVQLADALQMTTFERRQFFLASTGVKIAEMVRPNLTHSASDTANVEKEINKIKAIGDRLRVPAFLLDPYYDIVLANRSLMALFHVTDDLIASAKEIPHGQNSIHLNFGAHPISRPQMIWNWEYFALRTMRGFREVSLRYRATPYFQYLMQVFHDPVQYPFFERYWKMAASLEEDKEANWDYFEYKDVEYGHLKYMAEAVIFVTVYGELHLTQYLPLDETTASVFENLAITHGTEMLRFASWPVKKFPKE